MGIWNHGWSINCDIADLRTRATSSAQPRGEVRDNVEAFGCIANLTLHKGYFSDSLTRIEVPPLMAIWMDVDLRASATDVMTVLHKLNERGAVFSHECSQANFTKDKIDPGPLSAENVVPPIISAFENLGASATGRHIAHTTGSFWRSDRGMPVALANAVHRLAAKHLAHLRSQSSQFGRDGYACSRKN